MTITLYPSYAYVTTALCKSYTRMKVALYIIRLHTLLYYTAMQMIVNKFGCKSHYEPIFFSGKIYQVSGEKYSREKHKSETVSFMNLE